MFSVEISPAVRFASEIDKKFEIKIRNLSVEYILPDGMDYKLMETWLTDPKISTNVSVQVESHGIFVAGVLGTNRFRAKRYNDKYKIREGEALQSTHEKLSCMAKAVVALNEDLHCFDVDKMDETQCYDMLWGVTSQLNRADIRHYLFHLHEPVRSKYRLTLTRQIEGITGTHIDWMPSPKTLLSILDQIKEQEHRLQQPTLMDEAFNIAKWLILDRPIPPRLGR